MSTANSPRPVSVRFFPDYRDLNPYQDLLYRSLGPTVDAEPIREIKDLTDCDGIDAPILHLHWETAAFVDGKTSAEQFLDFVSAFRDGGGRIVWTIHNLAPHDHRYRAVAEEVRAGLLSLADILHLHSLPALAAALDWQPLPLNKVRLIPHGNFDGMYPAIPRDVARAELELENAQMVALMSGQIRAYKAPGALIEAFLEVARPEDRLLLAGHRASDVEDLTIPDDPRVVTKFGFLTAHELSLVHGAADFSVLPYIGSLTSGSAILSQTLARGVLGRDTPGLRDALSVPLTGILFDPNADGALADALSTAFLEGPEKWAARGAAAAQAVRARDWTVIGSAWRALFTELSGITRPARVLAP